MMNAAGTHCLHLKEKNETLKHFPKLLKCLTFENKEKKSKLQLHISKISSLTLQHNDKNNIKIWSGRISVVFSRQVYELMRQALWMQEKNRQYFVFLGWRLLLLLLPYVIKRPDLFRTTMLNPFPGLYFTLLFNPRTLGQPLKLCDEI